MSAALAEWLPWIQALGWTLVHFLWQGLVVGLAYGAVRALLPKTNCHARHAAGLAALALLALWPLATLVALRPQSVGADVVGGVITDVAALQAVATGEYDVATLVGSLLPWLVSLWVVGVLVGGWRALRQWHHLAQLARRWAVASPELETMVAALSQRFGFVRKVRVLVSRRVDTPMLIGWLKPVVLLPTAVALGFPRHQLELILAHELGHLRRYDHLVNLAQALLETLLFYHPVVHWISRDVRNERELCCDALVLGLTRGEPREYAQTLAALEELRQMPAAFALAASGDELLERVRRIIGMPAPRLAGGGQGQMRWLFAVALLGAGLMMALRVGREDATYTVPALSINWLQLPSSATLPLATLTLPFERPRLRLAEPGARVTASDTPAGPARPALPTLEGREATGSPPGPVPTLAPAVASPPVAVAGPEVASTPVRAADAGAASVAPPATLATAGTTPAADTAAPIATARPVATRIVQPRFPPFAQRAAGRIDASFAIAADGSVTDIRLTEGEAGSAFARAAERALKQWRFDPASLTPGDRARYTQTFVFAPSKGSGVRDECFKPTGSLVCRDPDDTSAATSYEVRH
jgi:TonB family protein